MKNYNGYNSKYLFLQKYVVCPESIYTVKMVFIINFDFYTYMPAFMFSFSILIFWYRNVNTFSSWFGF